MLPNRLSVAGLGYSRVEAIRRYSKLPLLEISNRLARSEHRSERTAPIPRRVTRRLSRKAIARLLTDYQAGARSIAQVANRLGLSPSSVYDALRRSGVEMRCHERGRRRPVPHVEI